MIPLFRIYDSSSHEWTVGNWYELRGYESHLRFHDVVSAAVWLRNFESDDLRRLAQRYDSGAPLSRLTDHKIVEYMARLIVSGYLRVCGPGTERHDGAKMSRAGREGSTEHRIILRLRATANEFVFEGNRLRIVRANQWSSLRASSEGRFQLVPRDVAQTLLKKLSEWSLVSMDERRALEAAISLVPDTTRLEDLDGILLVRIIARSPSLETASAEPASTPSRLAGQKPKEDLHWIEIELRDDNEMPVANEPYRLELPDGSIRTGKLDSRGCAHVGDIVAPGRCRISFPEIDEKEWRAA